MNRSRQECIRRVQWPVPLAVLWCGLLLSPAFRASGSQLTNVQTVFLIVMENHDWAGILGNTNCPYINGTLLPLASRAERYFTPTNLHPSEPNYLWLEAGTNFGILDDGSPAINHISSTNHLVTLLERAGVSWKTYQESSHAGDNPLTDSYPYIARHNPFIFFDDVATNAARLADHVRPYSELASDLKSNTVARYNFITPNLTNDMHDAASSGSSRRRQGDDWLAREAPKILSSAAFTNNGTLFIVWDEGDEDLSDGPIGLLLVSPLAKGRGYSNNHYYTHSSLLRTLQEIFAVEPLLADAANARNLSDLFLNAELSLSASLSPTNGPPQLILIGLIAGKTNVIQVSSNLAHWLSLSTNVATTNVFTFTDANNTNHPLRFYRAWELR